MKANITFYKLILILTLFFYSNHGSGQTQAQEDSYTRYELLEPESHSFRIIYDVSATTPRTNYYFNTLRKGSDHSVDAVYDRMTGEELSWELVDGIDAKADGLSEASDDGEYLKVTLPRPVPEGGAVRIRIDKTYKDPESYYTENGNIVFERTLGIKRNALVLPPEHEIISCNYPSQVVMGPSGRLRTSFMNRGSAAVPYKVVARKMVPSYNGAVLKTNIPPWPKYIEQPSGRDKSHARLNHKISERAFQNREIVYFLEEPDSHAFRLYHDYTETDEGVDKYVNVVREGSKAYNPSAKNLDTGKKLKVETLRGNEISKKGIKIDGTVTPETEVIVIWFEPVKKGKSVRIRIEETYVDPHRYLEFNGELIWDRSFGRNRNTVILPDGWYLTSNAIPALIDRTDEGLVRLNYINDGPDNIDVFIKGRRR